jgi:two-component system, cell cycle sensor histidine kinase and response regulator CckA
VTYRFYKSIRAHLLQLVLISILPALGIILYSGFDRQRDAIKDAELNMLAVANNVAAQHGQLVESARQLLTALAKLPDVRNLNREPLNRLFRDLCAENPVYGNLLVTDSRGNIVSSGLPFEPHTVNERKYFRDAVKTRDFSVGEYSLGKITGLPRIHFAYPVLDKEDRLKGIVVAAVNLNRYGANFLEGKLPEGASLSLTDHEGIRLFRYPFPEEHMGKPDRPEIMNAMREGPEEGTFSNTRNGSKALFAYKRFRLKAGAPPYLYLRVSILEKQALAGARRLLLIDLILFGIAFFVAAASAVIIGKAVIVNRVDKLVDASRRLGKGDLGARTGIPHREDELGQLAAAFDAMAEGLEQKDEGRKLAEEALTSQLHFLQNLIDTIPNAVFHKDTDGVYRGCNKAFEEYVGLPRERIVGRTVFEVNSKDVAETFHLKDNELFSNPGIQTYQTVVRQSSGLKRDVIVTKATYHEGRGRVAGLIGVMVDITERTRAEARLAYERYRFSTLSENAPFGMMMVDSAGGLAYLNPKAREMFGYDPPDIPSGREWFRAVFPDPELRHVAISAWLDDLKEAGAGGAKKRSFPVVCTDGAKKFVSFILTHLESGEEIVTCEDITLRLRAEETLKESEETIRALINATRESLVMTDVGGTILVANESLARRLGTRVETLIGTCLYDYLPPDVAMKRKEYYAEAVRTGAPVHFVDSRAGRSYETFCSPVFDGEGKVTRLAIFAHDVTESIRAEEEKARLESELRQSQKMEAIGTLAGGVAHDFNNILTAIIGYGSLLRMNMGKDDPKTVYADQILASSQKAAILTQSLLAFGRKQVMELKPHGINELIGEAENLLKRLLTEDIEFHVTLAASDTTIRADLTQIDQVLMNLAANARDAMPKGGKFSIETKTVSLDSESAREAGLSGAGTYAVIEAVDTGMGMDPKTREKIFEPFFTTKEVGKGTGLGLSIAYGIITQHNGHISVESEPGRGTRFTIYLPAIEALVETARREEEPPRGGKETILVAEDNDEVRTLAKEVLVAAGYTVIEATDGDGAVRQFRKRRTGIALLLLDVVMPRKNGKEAYEEILTLRPDVKVLFMSGYTGDVILTKGLRDEALNFISKPLTVNELLRKVREVLDK